MQRTTTHHRLQALVLLGLFLLSALGSSVHVLTHSHHHRRDLRVCSLEDGSSSDRQPHLHDAHYLSEDCDACAYWLGNSPILSDYLMPELPQVHFEPAAPKVFVAAMFSSFHFGCRWQRGPPVA